MGLAYGSLIFVLVTVSIVLLSDDSSTAQFLISDQARAASENELEINCETDQDMCLVEACLGNECSNISNGLGISIFSGMVLSGTEKICQAGADREEINNFNFRAPSNEPDEIGANNNLVKPSQLPSAWWDRSGSDILIGMDLGMIKRICDIDVLFNDKADIESGFSVTISNGSKSLHKVVSESNGSFPLDSTWRPGFDGIAGRFVYLTIPGVSEFYVDDDEDKPLVSEIKIKTFSPRNLVVGNIQADNVTKQIMSNNVTTQLELSPLEFLDAGSDLLNTPMFSHERYKINHSSLADLSSRPTPNMYTGDIFLP
jgi:hypothetical protein